jgi:hypothetical protein
MLEPGVRSVRLESGHRQWKSGLTLIARNRLMPKRVQAEDPDKKWQTPWQRGCVPTLKSTGSGSVEHSLPEYVGNMWTYLLGIQSTCDISLIFIAKQAYPANPKRLGHLQTRKWSTSYHLVPSQDWDYCLQQDGACSTDIV